MYRYIKKSNARWQIWTIKVLHEMVLPILNFESRFLWTFFIPIRKKGACCFFIWLRNSHSDWSKKSCKIKIQIWWIHVANSLYTNYSIAENRKKYNHPLHNLKTHRLNFKKQWVEIRILFAWQFWNISCNCHVLSTYICILQGPQSYVYSLKNLHYYAWSYVFSGLACYNKVCRRYGRKTFWVHLMSLISDFFWFSICAPQSCEYSN